MTGGKLKRLRIGKFRNVAPGTELVFNDGFNVPLGRNGTGKTTLLRLIATVVRGDFSKLESEEFDLDYDFAFRGLTITAMIRNLREEVKAEGRAPASSPTEPAPDKVQFDLSNFGKDTLRWKSEVTFRVEENNTWRELLSVRADASGAKATFSLWGLHESVVDMPSRWASPFHDRFDSVRTLELVLDSGLAGGNAALANRMHSHDDAAAQKLQRMVAQLTSWQSSAAAVAACQETLTRNSGRFDEALAMFIAITQFNSNAELGDVERASLSVARNGDDVSLRGWCFPQDVAEHLISARAFLSGSGDVIINDKDAAFLNKLVRALGATSADLVLRLRRREPTSEGGRLHYSQFEFLFTLEDGSIVNHDLLSYGGKRLLSFYYYLAANPDIVIADDLVNGLHYDWIETCLHEIGKRQAFLTSQNPLLLDFLPFGSPDDVRHTFITCRRELREGRVQMVWENMSEEKADSFYRAYKTKAMQVNEILRAEGLW